MRLALEVYSEIYKTSTNEIREPLPFSDIGFFSFFEAWHLILSIGREFCTETNWLLLMAVKHMRMGKAVLPKSASMSVYICSDPFTGWVCPIRSITCRVNGLGPCP